MMTLRSVAQIISAGVGSALRRGLAASNSPACKLLLGAIHDRDRLSGQQVHDLLTALDDNGNTDACFDGAANRSVIDLRICSRMYQLVPLDIDGGF